MSATTSEARILGIPCQSAVVLGMVLGEKLGQTDGSKEIFADNE